MFANGSRILCGVTSKATPMCWQNGSRSSTCHSRWSCIRDSFERLGRERHHDKASVSVGRRTTALCLEQQRTKQLR